MVFLAGVDFFIIEFFIIVAGKVTGKGVWVTCIILRLLKPGALQFNFDLMKNLC